MAGQVICDRTTDTGRARYRKESERSQLQDSFAELSQAERRIMSIREREKGNEYFNLLENDEALSCYCKSILLDDSNEKSYANRAAVFIRQSDFDLAIEDCTKALEINPSYAKALARRGMCYHKMRRFKEAVVDFEARRDLDTSTEYDRLLQRSKQKLDECDDGNVDGTPSGSDDDNERDVTEKLFTPGAFNDEQPCNSTISLEKSNGISQSVTNELHVPSAVESQAWHKMTIIEAESSDDEVVTGIRRINIAEEADSDDNEYPQKISKNQRDDSDKLKAEGNPAIETQAVRDERGLKDIAHTSEKRRKVRRHDSQALAF